MQNSIKLTSSQTLFVLLSLLIFVFIYPATLVIGTGIGALLGLVLAASIVWTTKANESLSLDHITPWLGLFFASFILTLGFSLSWPDFIPMGERLRDYALISSVLADPVQPKEPWLPMVGINYYVYWYRFGYFIHTTLGLSPAAVYHTLVSLTPALLVTVSAAALHFGAQWKFWSAILGGVLITFGSNLFGVSWFLSTDGNWWAPSRVIPGAINEFPMWSFVLGDAHPHFLNYAAPTALLLLVAAISSTSTCWKGLVLRFAIGYGLVLLFISGSNAWEMPVVLLQGTCLFLALTTRLAMLSSAGLHEERNTPSDPGRSGRYLILIASLLALASCFVLAALTVSPQHTKVTFIGSGAIPNFFADVLSSIGMQSGATDTPATTLRDLSKHWGIPLGLLVASLVLTSVRTWISLLMSLGLIVAAVQNSAFVALATLLLSLLADESLRFRSFLQQPLRTSLVCLGLGALTAVTLCEVFFVDDPYGGESERLNTIFKFYASAWTALHLYAFLRTGEGIRKMWSFQPGRTPMVIAGILIVGLWLGCFAKSVSLREGGFENLRKRSAGLATMERDYRGAEAVISFLRETPRSIVAEAEGNPYSTFGFVSTLGDQWTYLGWINHVQLLYTKEGNEIARRRDTLDFIYNKGTCEEIRARLLSEKISFLVVGPLEKQRYPGASQAERFACLRPIKEADQLRLLAP